MKRNERYIKLKKQNWHQQRKRNVTNWNKWNETEANFVNKGFNNNNNIIPYFN